MEETNLEHIALGNTEPSWHVKFNGSPYCDVTVNGNHHTTSLLSNGHADIKNRETNLDMDSAVDCSQSNSDDDADDKCISPLEVDQESFGDYKRSTEVSLFNVLVVLLAPIVTLPIIFSVDESFQKEARCGYVMAIVGIYLVTEAIPLCISALVPLLLFPAMNVMSAKETSAAYMNDGMMLFLATVTIAVGIEKYDLHKRAALFVVRIAGAEPKRALFGVALVTWFLAIWIKNTATTAMMTITVQSILEMYKDVNRGRKTKTKAQEEEYLNLSKAMYLTAAYSSSIGGTSNLTGTGANIIFYIAATDMFDDRGLDMPINFASWLGFGLPLSLMVLVAQWAWLVVRFLRCKGESSCCGCNRRQEVDDRIEKMNKLIDLEYRNLGPVSFAQKSVLVAFVLMIVCWLTRDFKGVGGWGAWFPPRTISDTTPAMIFAILMFVLPSTIPTVRGKKGFNIRYKPLLEWQDMHEKTPWSVFLLIGGGLALARASTKSGLSSWIGDQLLILQDLNVWLILLIICIMVTTTTECLANSTTTTLLLPVLSQMALSLKVNPLFFMFPATLSSSFAFMLPAATAPNAIVFSKGVLRVIDMVTTGIVLNVISVPLLLFAIATWGNAMFDLDKVHPEFLGNFTAPIKT